MTARRGSAAFANDWQWLVGFPLLAFLLWVLGKWIGQGTKDLLTGNTAFGAVIAAVIAFLITMFVCFVVRLFITPATLFYSEEARANESDRKLGEILAPKILISLDRKNKGISELPTEEPGPGGIPTKGPSSKWVQIDIACATGASLVGCEAWLVSVERLDGPHAGEELVEERVPCGWSQSPRVPQITIRPLLTQKANLFSLYENSGRVHLELLVEKLRLRDGIQNFGRYRLRIVAAAEDAPSAPASFIFNYQGFNTVTLEQE